jgi:hypothetical protein
MYYIWYMFIDSLSVAPIAVYHICYSAAVERQKHSLKKYMDKYVLYHVWYKMQWRVNHLHVPTVLKCGSLNILESSGLVQAWNGIALPFTPSLNPVYKTRTSQSAVTSRGPRLCTNIGSGRHRAGVPAAVCCQSECLQYNYRCFTPQVIPATPRLY